MNNRENAKKLLVYYFRLIALKAGIRWDYENEAEVASLVDNIFDEIEDSIENHNNAKVSHKV